MLTLLFTGLRISFLAYLLYLAIEWINQRFSIQELELEKMEAENKYLRNQLNPYFLFNTMNNLHGLILTDTKLASASFFRFSDFLQYMVYERGEDIIPLEKELRMVIDYIELERLRAYQKKIIQTDIEVGNRDYQIAPLLLLPLIENGIKHGLNVVEDRAFLRVSILQQGQVLDVTVENSKGAPIRKETKGIGLKNLKRRLELQYAGAHQLCFDEGAATYKVHLKIQLHAL